MLTACCRECSCSNVRDFVLTNFSIVCGGSTSTVTGTVGLTPCRAGAPYSEHYPDCAADGWVPCEWYYEGNPMSPSGGLIVDLIETSRGEWSAALDAGIVCSGSGAAASAVYSGSRTGCGVLVLSLVSSTLGTWPDTITLTPT